MVITINGIPRSKKNSSQIIHVGKAGKHALIPSKAFTEYQKDCGWYLGQYRGMKIDKPINLKVLYYIDKNKKVDLCNLLAATCDILVHYGVIADDDHRIVVSHDGSRIMVDKENPRAVIHIEVVDE